MADCINTVEGDALCCVTTVGRRCAGAAALQGPQLSNGLRAFPFRSGHWTKLHPVS